MDRSIPFSYYISSLAIGKPITEAEAEDLGSMGGVEPSNKKPITDAPKFKLDKDGNIIGILLNSENTKLCIRKARPPKYKK